MRSAEPSARVRVAIDDSRETQDLDRSPTVDGRDSDCAFAVPVADSHLARLRIAELDLVRRLFPAKARVLELGGGNGFQAAVLASWGLDVTSIDVGDGNAWARQFFPVSRYDGIHLPFPDDSFDVVFSSNVLEHVEGISELLKESARTLRRGGRAIHVLPTPAWRFWTICTHYPYLIKRLLRGRTEDLGLQQRSLSEVIRQRTLFGALRRAIIPAAHGEFRSSLEELFEYRGAAWTKRFQVGGFRVKEVLKTGVFYTGNALMPTAGVQARRRLGRLLGSACQVFVMDLCEAEARSG